MSRAPRTQAPREVVTPVPAPEIVIVPAEPARPGQGLLRRLDAAARQLEGVDHVRHEALVALISRLSSLKHHLGRLDDAHLDALIRDDLTAIAKLL